MLDLNTQRNWSSKCIRKSDSVKSSWKHMENGH